ncbi:hypothetical protein HDF16_000488 [Granulicella aggregans]|uniref:Polyketide cyclase/dehydrase/lipid transport protein n=1 Tax=Granulicella aggregans TaxID=474949 RepID=A0A7W8E250_9BACT|nr:SRPBCC domain-containing protein [Granulicella aggregans]MBB5055819.1 hypothetical protein [Granulicella aggregans]
MKWIVRSLIVIFSVCLTMILQFNFSSTSMSNLESLAGTGRIHESAPIKASVGVVADAPPDVVWRILTDINDWPRWQPGITKTEAATPLVSGSTFHWTIGGNEVHSKVKLIEPGRRIAWAGSAFDSRAVHVWTLEPLPGGKTRIASNESMDGILLSHMFSSKELADSDQDWLNALKAAAEKQPQP